MAESVTGVENEDDWEAALAEPEDLSDLEVGDDAEDPEDELTDEAGAQPDDAEGDDPEGGPEADAEAEHGAEAEGEQQEDPEGEEEPAGEPEPTTPEGETAVEPAATRQDDAPEQSDPFQQEHDGELTLRADGTTIAIPGSRTWEHGVYIPKDALQQHLQPWIADRRKLQSEIDRSKAALGKKSEQEAEAEFVLKFFADLMEDGDRAWEWFSNFDQNKDAFSAQAAAAREKARADGLQSERDEHQRAQDDQAFAEWAPQAVDSVVDHVLGLEEYQGLGIDAELVRKQMRGLTAPELFFKAAEDVPEEGLKKGQIYVNGPRIKRHVDALADLARAQRARQTDAEKVREAKEANARKGKRKAAPPAVPASGTPVPGDRDDEPESLEEWEASLL